MYAPHVLLRIIADSHHAAAEAVQRAMRDLIENPDGPAIPTPVLMGVARGYKTGLDATAHAIHALLDVSGVEKAATHRVSTELPEGVEVSSASYTLHFPTSGYGGFEADFSSAVAMRFTLSAPLPSLPPSSASHVSAPSPAYLDLLVGALERAGVMYCRLGDDGTYILAGDCLVRGDTLEGCQAYVQEGELRWLDETVTLVAKRESEPSPEREAETVNSLFLSPVEAMQPAFVTDAAEGADGGPTLETVRAGVERFAKACKSRRLYELA